VCASLNALRAHCYNREDSCAAIIRRGVEIGVISWKKLRITNDDIDILVRTSKRNYALACLEALKAADSKLEALDLVDRLCQSVKRGLITWQDMHTNYNELRILAHEATIREIETRLRKLSECPYDAIDRDADFIRDAVARRVITWKELRTTHKLFETSVHRIRLRGYRTLLPLIRKPILPGQASSCAKAITDAVAKGAITWEELGTEAEKLARWVEQAEPKRIMNSQ
jgi:hypothetical protein